MKKLSTALILSLCAVSCSDDAKRLAHGECPTLLPGWTKPSQGRSAFNTMNVITFSGTGIIWNGQPIPNSKLKELLLLARSTDPVPITVLDTSGAPDCDTATELQNVIDEAADCRGDGHCGLGTRKDWKNAPGLSGPGWIE